MNGSGKPLRILHVAETLETGGAERVLATIVNNLPQEDFLSFVCCTKNSGVIAKDIRNLAGPVIEMQRQQGNSYYSAFLLAKILKQFQIDIVHGHNWSTFCETVLGGVLARTPRIVNTIHGLHSPSSEVSPKSPKIMVRSIVEKQLARASGKICAVSCRVQEDILAVTQLPKTRVAVVYNGIDVSLFSRSRIDGNYRLESGNPGVVLCWAGRMVSVKNLSSLLEAMALVQNRAANIRLNLVGDGPDRNDLECMAKSLGIEKMVRFVGHTADVGYWLSLADVFVMPSHYEGFSVAILEAMVMGLPVIATSVGGNAESVVHGRTGMLVPPNDPHALANSILALCNSADKRIEMGKHGKARVLNEFSINKMMGEYIGIYRESKS